MTFSEKTHVDRVNHDRWQVAQAWEREHWLRNHKALARHGKNVAWRFLSMLRLVEKYRGDDRNHWWGETFDNYSFLPPAVDNALEVGCGPYTNIRLISRVCTPRHLYLSDPLIQTYLGFNMTFLNETYRNATCYLDDHPLEELPFADDYFELAVMINVLDHVRDASMCMNSLIRVVKPGGFVIIGQDLSDLSDLERQPDGLRVGHPVTLHEKWFDAYLKNNFDQVFGRILPREAGWAPEWHYGTLCFAGRKR
jgi:ubiquinone/menaquinone biosynthesis C-methylase UbiE